MSEDCDSLKEALKEEIEKKAIKDGNLDIFAEGYKAGFRDGYKAAMEEIMLQLRCCPDGTQKLVEESAKLYSRPW